MTTLRLITHIKAPAKLCFNLSRSIDLHVESMAHTNEVAIGGKRNGLIGLNECVIWEARHFFVQFRMKVKITRMNMPESFTDEMEEGPFKSMIHHHLFEEGVGTTIMTDIFTYEVPFGIIGTLFNHFFLRNYMTRLLNKRNEMTKKFAEARDV